MKDLPTTRNMSSNNSLDALRLKGASVEPERLRVHEVNGQFSGKVTDELVYPGVRSDVTLRQSLALPVDRVRDSVSILMSKWIPKFVSV